MLDNILQCVHAFEHEHGTSPDVVYINPFHYDGLRRYHPSLFLPGAGTPLGVRLVIVPAAWLQHPEAARLDGSRSWSDVA